jgi:hypothetical protein
MINGFNKPETTGNNGTNGKCQRTFRLFRYFRLFRDLSSFVSYSLNSSLEVGFEIEVADQSMKVIWVQSKEFGRLEVVSFGLIKCHLNKLSFRLFHCLMVFHH